MTERKMRKRSLINRQLRRALSLGEPLQLVDGALERRIAKALNPSPIDRPWPFTDREKARA